LNEAATLPALIRRIRVAGERLQAREPRQEPAEDRATHGCTEGEKRDHEYRPQEMSARDEEHDAENREKERRCGASDRQRLQLAPETFDGFAPLAQGLGHE